jgi:hypothetical protein
MKRRTLNCLEIAFLCSFVSGMPHVASGQLPKPQRANEKCSCQCKITVGGGLRPVDVTWNNNTMYACLLYDGYTCNVTNPYTGLASSGYLSGCTRRNTHRG